MSIATSVLCVDLDGTLTCTDTLLEQLLTLAKRKPLVLFTTLLSLRHGLAHFKRAVAINVPIDPEALPYNGALLAYLREQASGGRRILLVTAADKYVADSVARHLGLFETVLASDGNINLKAHAKLHAIRSYLGDEMFEYAGDSSSDLPVWKAASSAILVGVRHRLKNKARGAGVHISREFPRRARLSAFVRCMRVYQWLKNLLVFVPLFLSHTLLSRKKLPSAVVAFAALSLAASVVYITNDLLDLDADRRHPVKRHRPFASWVVTIAQGILLAVFLLCSAAVACIFLPPQARLLVLFYIIASTAYSALLKRMLFIDVIVLAGLYSLRVLYGGIATHITITPSTLAFFIFWFISLAICKRLTELRHTVHTDAQLPGRAYSQQDLSVITSLGTASGYAAVLVLALYISGPDVTALYSRPEILWCLCPLLTYWISRMLIIANRGNMHSDPIVFACRDRASYAVATAVLLTIAAAL